MRLNYSYIVLIGSAALAGSAVAAAHAQGPELIWPEGPGKTETVDACTQCHNAQRVLELRHSPEEWNNVVQNMIDMGALIDDEERPVIQGYLAAALGKPSTGSAPALEVPVVPASDTITQ